MAMTPSNGAIATYNASFSLKPERTAGTVARVRCMSCGWAEMCISKLPSILSQIEEEIVWLGML